MKILVNGDESSVADGATVAELVDGLAGRRGGVAVAVNEDVVPRTAWEATALKPGDRVEILTAVQGG
jgi:sulfur carrier protein